LQQLFPPPQAPEAPAAAAPARPPVFDRFAAALRPAFRTAAEALDQAQTAIRNLQAASRPRLARTYERGHTRAQAFSADLSQKLKMETARLRRPRLGSLPQQPLRARLRSLAGAWLALARDFRLALRRNAVFVPPSYRDLQWRKAAVTSSAVALIAIIGLASALPPNPASKASPVIPRSAEAQLLDGINNGIARPALSSTAPAARPPDTNGTKDANDPLPQSDLTPPASARPVSALDSARARRQVKAQRSQPRASDVSDDMSNDTDDDAVDDAADDVADDVIIRHFRPAPRRDTAEALPKVKRFSDLD
jgi:hypothetical protein